MSLVSPGFRRSMSFLHSWVSLPLGWLLFFIFVMGSISYYHKELTFWMQPELHGVRPNEQDADAALRTLAKEAPEEAQWTLTLPNERTPYFSSSWRDPSAAQQGGHRAGMKRVILDPASGEIIEARQTSGGSFLYRLHVQLFGMERFTGMMVIGVAGLVMLLALVSGVFVHASIFKDFFTFRPGRGKLSWRDAHNASAVLAYPFHIVLTFSGLLLLAMMLVHPIIDTRYDGDTRSFLMGIRGMNAAPATGQAAQTAQSETSNEGGRPGQSSAAPSGQTEYGGKRAELSRSEQGARSEQPGQGEHADYRVQSEQAGGAEQDLRSQPGGRERGGRPEQGGHSVRAELPRLAPFLAQAREIWPHGAGSLTIANPAKGGNKVEASQARGDSVIDGGAKDKLVFNAVTGELLEASSKREQSVIGAIWRTLSTIHLGRFASPLPRFLLFCSGLFGAGMVASGLVMWNINRKKKVNDFGRAPLSHRLVESLNIAAIPGLFIATGAYLAASRMLPADLAGRTELEKKVFFAVWITCLIHALLRWNKKKAWAESFVTAGSLLVLLPALNALTGGAHLGVSLSAGLWQLAAIDVFCLLLGGSFLIVAQRVVRHERVGEYRLETDAKQGLGLELALNRIESRSAK